MKEVHTPEGESPFVIFSHDEYPNECKEVGFYWVTLGGYTDPPPRVPGEPYELIDGEVYEWVDDPVGPFPTKEEALNWVLYGE